MLEQSLKDHAFGSAAHGSLCINGRLVKSAFFCNVISDMGKAKKEYADYLTQSVLYPGTTRPGSVNHTFACAKWIMSRRPEDGDFFTQTPYEILAYAACAHHGLFDFLGMDNREFGLEYRLTYDNDDIHYEESVKNFYSEVVPEKNLEAMLAESVNEISLLLREIYADAVASYDGMAKVMSAMFSSLGFLTRMLLSAVIYGDRKDTIEFMDQIKIPVEPTDWDGVCRYFEDKMKTLDKSTPINEVRHIISEQCLNSSSHPCGVYRLNVPTGGGKTLSSFRFAIHHARKWNKKRIIYVIPFLTIIEQNADVIREYFKYPERFLEHHSNIINDLNTPAELREYDLLTTTWDSSVIMTTMVQFLNALFLGRTSCIGRMQALNDAVIIFDEIQSMPTKCTYLFNEAINYLNKYCNSTVVLCSATQPTLEQLDHPLFMSRDAELVHLTVSQRAVFRTSEVVDKTTPSGMSLKELAKFAKEVTEKRRAVMLICNTKKQARRIYKLANGMMPDTDVVHLSTHMCRAHINCALDAVKCELKKIQKNERTRNILLVSTQIPEAGVDISFASVIRVVAGLDNEIQADGRCNRNNEYGSGVTYIVNLNADAENTKYLPDIADAQRAMMSVLLDKSLASNLLSDEAIERYYRQFFNFTKNGLGYPYEGTSLMRLLSNDLSGPNTYFMKQPLKTIGEVFSVFDKNTIDVVVPYKPFLTQVEELKACLAAGGHDIKKLRVLFRRLRGCTISIYDNEMKKLEENGLLFSYGDRMVFVLSDDAYSDEYGLIIPDEDEEDGLFV